MEVSYYYNSEKTNKSETVSITHINNGKETKATESSMRDIRRLFGN